MLTLVFAVIAAVMFTLHAFGVGERTTLGLGAACTVTAWLVAPNLGVLAGAGP